MEEFHRLVRNGGTVRIETPHYTDFSSFCDPTHRSHLNSFSSAISARITAASATTPARLARCRCGSSCWVCGALGFEFLVNHFRGTGGSGSTIFVTWCAERSWNGSLKS